LTNEVHENKSSASVKTSFFEIFKIGIGPSSSHTVGPMRAAHAFVSELRQTEKLCFTSRVQVELFGSLALTGKGHATDRAIILGLLGELPDTVDPASIETKFSEVQDARELKLGGSHAVHFEADRDLLFLKQQTLPAHPNGMRFSAFAPEGEILAASVYYSVGGGFIRREGEENTAPIANSAITYPFSSARELLETGDAHSLAVWEIALANEIAWSAEAEVRGKLEHIWQTMEECINRGLNSEGILPGGLKVRRRASTLYKKLTAKPSDDPLAVLDWVAAFAMAVNEENAAGGRVVTAPTNGAAGIIPAVGRYYLYFVPGATREGILRYLLTAGAIAILYKENASISGAEVGCQGEVGVACSMAAGGLVAAVGGDNHQVEYAAEIGMEHNLGMTCDPIGGLVQIPCIERNAMGAVKAINACRMAMNETGAHKVSLDQVIETMYRTGLDMQMRYKETSLGGLALNIIEC
jgi:L-serine dehydratase